MYANHRGTRSRPLVSGLLIASLLGPANAAAATVLAYDFDDGAGGLRLAPAAEATFITAGPLADIDGTITDLTGVSGRAAAAKDWHDGNAFVFALTVAPGVALVLEGLAFAERASASGPTAWSLAVAGTEVASGATTSGTFGVHDQPLAGAPLTGLVTFTLAGSGATTASGTWRIDDLVLRGALHAVPLPAAGWLFASAVLGAGLPRFRRRGR
ncbi:MAG: hypothetical protein IT495_13820 [Gammaproteobacteria bacterium]|nr:hypothetical protein [Gammaproteobacteria bacterium]